MTTIYTTKSGEYQATSLKEFFSKLAHLGEVYKINLSYQFHPTLGTEMVANALTKNGERIVFTEYVRKEGAVLYSLTDELGVVRPYHSLTRILKEMGPCSITRHEVAGNRLQILCRKDGQKTYVFWLI